MPYDPAAGNVDCTAVGWTQESGSRKQHTWPGKERSTSSSVKSTYGMCPLAAVRPAGSANFDS